MAQFSKAELQKLAEAELQKEFGFEHASKGQKYLRTGATPRNDPGLSVH